MKELSVFIDESGDFGEYDDQAPYYIITMVFHDQSQAITDAVQKLDQELSYMDLNDLCIHTGPIVRREETYEFMPITERRRIFNKLVAFFRQVDMSFILSPVSCDAKPASPFSFCSPCKHNYFVL